MATVKFFIQSTNPNANIFCYFSAGRGQFYKRKTRETINPDHWNPKTGKPKNIQSADKDTLNHIEEVKKNLINIESFILEQYRKRTETETINGDWLDEIITAHYTGGRRIEKLDYIENYLEHYLTVILPFRKYKGQPISHRTRQKHETIISKFQDFLLTEKTRLKVSDYNIAVGNRFVTFLRAQNLNDNTVGKYLKYTKTIFRDAKTENIAVNNQLDEIKGFTTETPTHYLIESELSEIQDLKLVGAKLELTRDWLIIGCYTGQRASDLFGMTKKKIVNLNGKEYINLSQNKTKTPVLVPIHSEVKKILDKRNGEFPPVFSANVESSKTLFNKHLETVCKLAGIDRLEYGRVWDDEKKCFVFGDYPFYQLVSSHVCRRTFATMYYGKIPTVIIMSVTGHKTEREFLGYIGIDNSTLSEQMYTYWEELDNDAKNAPIEPQQTQTAN
ncbi:phage integrase SAM-like domain-containing protein [Chryseobacterium sp. A321]